MIWSNVLIVEHTRASDFARGRLITLQAELPKATGRAETVAQVRQHRPSVDFRKMPMQKLNSKIKILVKIVRQERRHEAPWGVSSHNNLRPRSEIVGIALPTSTLPRGAFRKTRCGFRNPVAIPPYHLSSTTPSFPRQSPLSAYRATDCRRRSSSFVVVAAKTLQRTPPTFSNRFLHRGIACARILRTQSTIRHFTVNNSEVTK